MQNHFAASLCPWFAASHPVLERLGEPNLVVRKGDEDPVGAAHVLQVRRQIVDDVHDGRKVCAVDVDFALDGVSEEALSRDEEVLDVGAVADVPHCVEVCLQLDGAQGPQGYHHGLS